MMGLIPHLEPVLFIVYFFVHLAFLMYDSCHHAPQCTARIMTSLVKQTIKHSSSLRGLLRKMNKTDTFSEFASRRTGFQTSLISDVLVEVRRLFKIVSAFPVVSLSRSANRRMVSAINGFWTESNI